jgi:carboxylesterase
MQAARALMGEGDPAPLIARGKAPELLAFHGFGGTPLEVALLVEVAEGLGLGARAPLLPGHGTSARDLAKTGFREWSQAAEAALDDIAEPALVAGLSLGSLLAAHLAACRPDRVRALVMLANACWLSSPFPTWPLRMVSMLGLPDFSVRKIEADIADPVARRTHLTYPTQPVHAAIEVLRTGERVRSELPRVHCPVLIVHGRRDRVCPAKNAARVARLLGSNDVRVVVLPRSRHIVTRDLERALLERELRSFFSRFAAAQRPVEP